MLQANKVVMLARSRKKKLPNLQNVNSQMRAYSGADMWKNRAFYDKSMKLGTWPD